VDIVVLEEVCSSYWASSSLRFVIPKENGEITLFTDFRNINLLLEWCMSPITYPKDWKYNPLYGKVDLCHNLNMGYCQIKIDVEAYKLCTINCIPMGIILVTIIAVKSLELSKLISRNVAYDFIVSLNCES
jgi:hypothetical protein